MSAAEHEFKILVIGETGVGKTSLSKRFKDDEFKAQTKETIVATVMQKELEVLGRQVLLKLFDTAGHPSFRALIIANYFSAVDGVLLVYDVTHGVTLDTLTDWLKHVKNLSPSATVLVVGNKADHEDSEKKASKNTVQQFVRDERLEWMETSAKHGHNVQKVFEHLTLKILVQKQLIPAANTNVSSNHKVSSTEQELPKNEQHSNNLSTSQNTKETPPGNSAAQPPSNKVFENVVHEQHTLPEESAAESDVYADQPSTQDSDTRIPNGLSPSETDSLSRNELSEEESFVVVYRPIARTVVDLPPILCLSDEVPELSINRFKKMSSDSISSLVDQNEEFDAAVRQHREAQRDQKSKEKCCIL